MKKILVIVDMQNDFIDGSLGTSEAKAVVDKIVDEVKDRIWDKIIVTMDTHPENYLETAEGKKLPVRHCIENTNGWLINDKIYNAIKEFNEKYGNVCIVKKPTFGCLDLPNYFKQDENDFSVEFVGVCTDICVVSNALITKAAFYENNISVKEKCCAGTTLQNHEKAIDVMRSCQINII